MRTAHPVRRQRVAPRRFDFPDRPSPGPGCTFITSLQDKFSISKKQAPLVRTSGGMECAQRPGGQSPSRPNKRANECPAPALNRRGSSDPPVMPLTPFQKTNPTMPKHGGEMRSAAIVRALASQGDEIALSCALHSTQAVRPSHRVSTALRQQSVSLW